MDSEEQIKQLKEELYKAPTIFEWVYIGGEGGSSSLSRWAWGIVCTFALPSALFFGYNESVGSDAFWVLFFCAILMLLISRFLFNPDTRIHYHLTPFGVYYTEQQIIPEVAYKIVRGIAWVGIGVCIIAAFMLGPLAFVGAGAFALMSFGMIDFQPKVNNFYVLISDHTLVFHVSNDGVVSFEPKESKGLEYVQTIYISTPEQKSELFAHLKLLFTDIETVEVKRLNDQYKHPIYKQEEVVE